MNKSSNTILSAIAFLFSLIGSGDRSEYAGLFQVLAPGSSVSKAAPDRVTGVETLYSLKTYKQLSDQFNFRMKMVETGNGMVCYDCKITLQVFSKNDSLVQTIKTRASSCAYPFTYKDVSHVRSYETHYNQKRELADGYYNGELVVGDFNFDSLTDIAIVKMYPMSGTPTYAYYFQNEHLEFVRNDYFSGIVQHLPQQLNSEKKTFMNYDHTGCCWQKFRYFKFDETGKCRLFRTRKTGPEE